MEDLTEQQKKKLFRLAKIADTGEIGILDEINTLDEKIDKIIEDVSNIIITNKGADGKNGIDGINGRDGVNGINGRDGRNGINGKDGINGIDGKDGRDGKDGKDGSPDTGEDVINKINSLEIIEDLQIDASHIKNLPRGIDRIIERIGGGGISQVYHDGTLSGAGTQENPLKTNTGLITLVATGVINDNNTSFTFIQKPTYIIKDGIWYRENNGFTWDSGTLTATLSVPPQYDIWGLI